MLLRAVLEIVLILLLARAFWNLVGGILQGVGRQPSPDRDLRAPRQAVPMVRDPVCGTFVLPDRAVSIADARGRVYFCSSACRDTYRSRTA